MLKEIRERWKGQEKRYWAKVGVGRKDISYLIDLAERQGKALSVMRGALETGVSDFPDHEISGLHKTTCRKALTKAKEILGDDPDACEHGHPSSDCEICKMERFNE